ncbi:TolC family protein [Algoriphagus sp.]|uniref:TolC family protein n=1 Tax=Algoriphagus sp. TaxID=1872435 RepID=UPI003F6E8DE3
MKRLFMYRKCSALVVGILLSAAVQAQDTLKIDFREAVDLALSANVDYQVLSNNMEVLKVQKQSALLSHFPNVNINSSFSQQKGQQTQQIEGQIVVTSVTNEVVNAGLNVSMPIFNAGRRILDTQSSKLAYEAGEKGLDRASQQIVFDVARRYLQVLLDQELVRISIENLENQKETLRQIDGFVDAGLRTLSDKYNQQSEVARLESVLVDAELQYQNDVWDLSEYLQLGPGEVPVLEPVDPSTDKMGFDGMSMTELYDIAMANRPDGTQQTLLVESLEKNLKASKAMYYPRVAAFYNYNTFFYFTG